jgi:hypothetical protein
LDDTVRALIELLTSGKLGPSRGQILPFFVDLAAIRLREKRDIPALGIDSTSAGRTQVTVPSELIPGRYFLIACADDTRKVAERDEMNNCAISAASVQVGR